MAWLPKRPYPLDSIVVADIGDGVMNDDNLNGTNLSVLECRALLADIGPIDKRPGQHEALRLYPHRTNAIRKLESGARKELPDETRERLLQTDSDEARAELKRMGPP